MDGLCELLGQLGLGVATNAIYGYLKGVLGANPSKQEVTDAIQNLINMSGVDMSASTVISALAENGFLVINNSNLHANDSIVFGSFNGGAVIGNGSKLSTNKSSTVIGHGAAIQTSGNAFISHNADGSISFHVGSQKISSESG
jgi:hypothetical protein